LKTEYNIEIHESKKSYLVENYTIVNGKTSQGVVTIYNEEVIPKGAKFTQKILKEIDYTLNRLLKIGQLDEEINEI
jgi:DNA-directed RNA polymerase subunit beta